MLVLAIAGYNYVDATECSKYHVLKKGEYLSKIAKSMGLNPSYEVALKLAKANHIKNPNRVEIGDKVCLDTAYYQKEGIFDCVNTMKGNKICIDQSSIQVVTAQKVEPGAMPEVQPLPVIVEVEEPAPVIVPVSKPQLATAAVENDEEEQDQDMRMGFGISPFLSYSRIEAEAVSNQAKGTVRSNPDYGAEFKFTQLWGKQFSSEIFIVAERKTYKTDSIRAFADHGGALLNYGIGVSARPVERLEFKFKAFYGDEAYFRAPNTTSLAIDFTRAFKMDFATMFDIIATRYASTGVGGGVRLIVPGSIDVTGGTSYNAKTGYGFFGLFYLRHRFNHLILEESYTYENLYKDTDLFKQTHTQSYIKASFIVLF